MSGPHEQFGISADASTEGVWLDYGDYAFHVTYTGEGTENKKFKKMMTAKLAPYTRYLEDSDITPPESALKAVKELTAEVFASTVILGWRDMTGKDGKPLAFNPKNCKTLLLEVPVLFAKLQEETRKFVNFQGKQRDADSKNS